VARYLQIAFYYAPLILKAIFPDRAARISMKPHQAALMGKIHWEITGQVINSMESILAKAAGEIGVWLKLWKISLTVHSEVRVTGWRLIL
jgi:hypothetical protein